MKRIAIIPARSGSKGLKNKNIIDICGKPLLAYSVEAALRSGIFDRVILSTDSEQYAEIGRRYGAEVLMRSKELSNDRSTTFAVIEDVLCRLQEDNDYFMLLQPTSPMRTSLHIREAAQQFEEKYANFDFLVSVKEAEHPNILVRPIGTDLSLKDFDVDYSSYRRQETRDYSPNGAIFIAKPECYLRQKHFFGARATAYIMSKKDSIDIDDEIDYRIACAFMEK